MKKIPDIYQRYLHLIGIQSIPSGASGLRKIIRNHLCSVPFENVSKLLLFQKEKSGRSFTLAEFLDGIEHQDLGGTCHSNNPFLVDLLKVLGYKAFLLGADMDEPNVHTCICVLLESIRYHIDVGYAAPFREPIRLDDLPHEITHGEYLYIFDKGMQTDEYVVSVYLNHIRVHGYTVLGPPRNTNFFDQTISESFGAEDNFMSHLHITRFFSNHAVELKDSDFTYFKNGTCKRRKLKDMDEVKFAVKNDLAMPRCPIQEAIEILEQITEKSFFRK